MKKLIFGLMAVVILWSCEKEKQVQELQIDNRNLTVKYGDSIKIEALSDMEITYNVYKAFHAWLLDDGWVKGRHVGETMIEVQSGGDALMVNLEVLDKTNFFPDPDTQWSNTRADIRIKYGEPNYDSGTEYTYFYITENALGTLFSFTAAGTLEYCGYIFDLDDYVDVLATLYERYEYYGYSDGIAILGDALDVDDARLAVGLQSEVSKGWAMVLYMNTSMLKSGKLSSPFENLKSIRIN